MKKTLITIFIVTIILGFSVLFLTGIFFCLITTVIVLLLSGIYERLKAFLNTIRKRKSSSEILLFTK